MRGPETAVELETISSVFAKCVRFARKRERRRLGSSTWLRAGSVTNGLRNARPRPVYNSISGPGLIRALKLAAAANRCGAANGSKNDGQWAAHV